MRSARHRVLLAALLLRAGELVMVDELAEAVWGDALPASPRKAIQTHVSRLRSLLSGTELIQWQPTGYVMRVGRDEFDVGLFELLLEQAGDAASKGDRHAEADALREALALWRGEPLVDVPSDTLHRDAARLAEQRLDAVRRRIEADLELGRHAELVPELRALTDKYPLLEHHWGLLMTALYRCGRQADALEAYRSVSRLLASELGVDPGPELRALHQAILTNDPALAVPSPIVRGRAWTRPSQLPPDLADFVGRADLVDQIGRLLGDDRAVTIVALSGPPGVGKTALAVHAAHRLAASYPDGQLFVNLHGATAGLQPLAPLEVLGRFLRALGTDPAAIPTDLEETSGLFRSRVADRRLLVVLDDAADAAQVAPLLPAAPGCGGAGDQPAGAPRPGRRPLPAPGRAAGRRGGRAARPAGRSGAAGGRPRRGRRGRPLVRLAAAGAADRGGPTGGAAWLAGRRVGPAAGRHPAAAGRALAWLEAERANMLAAVRQAATSPGVPDEIGTQLAQALFGFFYIRSCWEDCEQVNQTVLAVAQRTGDRAAQARAYNDLGVAYLRQGRYDRSLTCHQEGLALYRELGDRRGQAGSLTNLGVVHRRRGRYAEALASQQESLAIQQDLGDLHAQGEILRELGVTLRALGRLQAARSHWLEALAIFERLRTTADAEQVRALLADLAPTSRR